MSLSERCMNIVLEVDDLTAASPATVSRCGMVLVPADTVPWQSLVQAWLKELPATLGGPFYSRERSHPRSTIAPTLTCNDTVEDISAPLVDGESLKAMIEQLSTLFDSHLESSLRWLSQNAHEPIPTTLQQRVQAVCTWLQVILHPMCGWDYAGGHGTAEQIAVCNVFAFSIVWGLGGALQGDSRIAWDTKMRAEFDGEASFPAGAGLVFDYCCNPAHNYTLQVRYRSCARHYKHASEAV